MKYKLIKLMTILLSIILFSTVLTGCSQNKANTINIATKPMTEQFILGEMLKQLIEEDIDVNIKITKGIGGGTSNIHPAIVKGEFDMYPEYTSSAWNMILKKSRIPDSENLMNILKKEYKDKYNLEWVGMYGFNNTYGLAIRKEIAKKYNIKTYSDLSKYSSKLTFGAEYDFYDREDGYDELCKAYKFDFKNTVDLDIGLKYNAINSKEIDVMNVFTTDGQLASSNVVLIEDDKSFYETYYCSTVVKENTLKKYPEIKNVLLKMDNILTEKEMSVLNSKVEIQGMNEKDVAREFLQSKGLIKK